MMATTAATGMMISMTNEMEKTMNTIVQEDTNIGFILQSFLTFGPFVAHGRQVVRRTPTSPAPSTPRRDLVGLSSAVTLEGPKR